MRTAALGYVFQAVTHYMDIAQLDMGLREDVVYRIRKALQVIHTGNQDVLKGPVFSSVSTLSQNFAPSFSAATYPATWDYSFRQFGIVQADAYISRIAAVFDVPLFPVRSEKSKFRISANPTGAQRRRNTRCATQSAA